MIRLPRLLDENLREKARLTPVKLSLHLTLAPLSGAELILPSDAPPVSLRDFIELYDENGSIGIFRVTRIDDALGNTRALHLEHGLATLRDSVIPAQGFMSSVADALTRLLACQSLPRWTVGDVETPEDLTLIFATEYTNLLSAVEALLGMLPEGYALAFDQTVTPWQLHLRALNDTDRCEGRLHRNLQSIRHTVNGSRLCTRVYPFGAEVETGRISLVPLSGSDHADSDMQAELGLISHTFANDLIYDVPTLHEVAQRYLSRHVEPETTTVVSALDLSAATGEAIDRFRPGKLCRLCLPEMGRVISHRIVAIDREDVYGAPGQAVLTLSNRLKVQSEQEEIDEMVRQVIAGKLLGGTVTEIVQNNRAHGTFTAPVVQYFDVEDWAALLDVRVSFRADSGASIRDVRVDNMHPEDTVWKGGSFSAMPYLRRDELGQIAQGQHLVSFLPYGSSASASVGVSSTVTMTVIEKTTT